MRVIGTVYRGQALDGDLVRSKKKLKLEDLYDWVCCFVFGFIWCVVWLKCDYMGKDIFEKQVDRWVEFYWQWDELCPTMTIKERKYVGYQLWVWVDVHIVTRRGDLVRWQIDPFLAIFVQNLLPSSPPPKKTQKDAKSTQISAEVYEVLY